MSDAGVVLERSREVAVLERAIAQGGVVVVRGPFGIGKTTLLRIAEDRAEAAGLRVLVATGAEAELEYTYGVVQQLVDRPELVFGSDEEIAGEVFARAAGDAHVCVIVDDLHWADSASVSALAGFGAKLGAAGGVFITALEPALARDEHAVVMRGDGVAVLSPERLSAQAVATALAHTAERAVPLELAYAYREATGGLPFVLHELTTALASRSQPPSRTALAACLARPPRAVRRAVASRLARLTPVARRFAYAAAALGDGRSGELAAALAGSDPVASADEIDRLIAFEILASRSPIAFNGRILSRAVLCDLSVTDRAQLRADAARLLAETGARPDDVARHLLEAPYHAVDSASDILAAAATGLEDAPSLALRYLQRAADEAHDPSGSLLASLGRANLRLGRSRAAADSLARAISVITEPEERLQAKAELAGALIHQGRSSEAATIAADAAAAARAHGSDMAHVLEATLAVAGWSDERVFRDLRRSVPSEPPRVDQAATEGEHVRLGRIAAEHALHGGACDARRLAQSTSSERLERGRHLIAFHLREVALAVSDAPGALEAINVTIEETHRRGGEAALGFLAGWRTLAHMRRGDLEDVERLASTEGGPLVVLCAAEVHLECGRLRDAGSALDSVDPDAGWGAGLLRLLTLGRLRLRENRPRDALDAFDECRNVEAAWRFGEPCGISWRAAAALAYHVLGDAPHAQSLAQEATDRARRLGSERLQGVALRVAARVGALATPEELLREAIALLDRAAARLEGARARADLASVLRRDGYTRDARALLQEAAPVARGLGAASLLGFVNQELALTGERRAGSTGSSGPVLTPAERRTASLAAEGLTNREIAARLVLSERTVEFQLSNVYRKLGIQSRTDVEAALIRFREP